MGAVVHCPETAEILMQLNNDNQQNRLRIYYGYYGEQKLII